MADQLKQQQLPAEFGSVETACAALTDAELQSLALQTRSTWFRDYLARSVTAGIHDYDQLVASVRSNAPQAIFHPQTAALLAQIVTAQRLGPNDPSDALAIYEQLLRHYQTSFLTTEDRITYADLLVRASRAGTVAEDVASLRIADYAPAESLVLQANAALTNHGTGTEAWLAAFNVVFSVDRLTPLNLVPGAAPVFDRLESTSVPASVDGPLVTVIVPTWNPGPWLWTAVRSLTQQTYASLQILVIDDHSSPKFTSQLERIRVMDSRIQVITNDENRGTYASRNAAVRDYAHGDYVTIQDDDDWSHPQRIERQVKFSQAEGLAITIGRAVRVTEDLRFVRRAQTFIRRGYPTTLISRNTFSEVGFWDPVRRNSDFEFIRRVRRSGKSVKDLGQAPLLFQRHREGSLSSGEVWQGYSAQSRRWQNWLSAEWHDRNASVGRRIYMGSGLGLDRPYPAPVGLTRRTNSEIPIRVDVLVISDYGYNSPSEHKSLMLAHSLLARGKSVGLIHTDGVRPLADTVSPEVAALTRQSGVVVLSWDDETIADDAHIMEPDNLLLCDTVQSRILARKAILHEPRENVKEATSRLLHLDRANSIHYA